MGKFLFEGPIGDNTILSVVNDGGDDLHAGASSLFLGRVRADIEKGRSVTAIEYSAYPEMADKEAEEIIRTVKTMFSDVRDVLILHSTGVVRAGEVSLIIKVTAGHRNEAVKACSVTLELIKERLPVWKKEFFDDQSSAWKEI